MLLYCKENDEVIRCEENEERRSAWFHSNKVSVHWGDLVAGIKEFLLILEQGRRGFTRALTP